jgi:PelA/Pel-15E family pectate lyase
MKINISNDLRSVFSPVLRFVLSLWISAVLCWSAIHAQEPPKVDQSLEVQAKAAMKKAGAYFHDHVAVEGGYPYLCAADLSSRWGENMELENAVMVQPPGTPAVGIALLDAYKATSDKQFLDWASAAASALIAGQLKSGGWDQVIYFTDPKSNRMGAYRNRKGGKWNNSSLDDNKSQSALLFLIQMDEVFQQKNEAIHEAVSFGLDSLLAAQFPNGGFPQVWNQKAESRPVLNASYPTYDWKTEGRIKNYWDHYTLNDGLAGDVVAVLAEAYRVHRDDRFLNALKKHGEFLLQAQMPAPQPAWCQQYNAQMQPMWARKFEPPAIASSESQDVMEALIQIAAITKDQRYLSPIPESLKFFREKCLIGEGQFSRFYELQTNKPLFMNRNYELTYDDGDVPTHYGWKVKSKLDQIEKHYQQVRDGKALDSGKSKVSEKEVARILETMDPQGRWVKVVETEILSGTKLKKGDRYLSSQDFINNMKKLAIFVKGIKS